MNVKDVFILILEIAAILLLCYAVYREKNLIKFEHKAWVYIKAFFKALYYTAKDYAGKTNFAKIKRMNADELAQFMCDNYECGNCPVCDATIRNQLERG